MIPYLHDILHVIQIVLTFIGGGTVLGFVGWLYKRRQENFEDEILVMFASGSNQEWRTTEGIHSDYGRQQYKDTPMWVILPVHTNRWEGFKWRVRTIPYQVRYFWRKNFFMPSAKKVQRTVLGLWKRGLLVRSQTTPNYYKLKS